MEKQPDEPEDFTNEPLPSMSEPMEVQDAVASTLATPFAQPIITASKSKAQKHQIEVQAQSTWNNKWASSIMRFKSTFLDNDFGYACSVCDRLWFRNDLKSITAAQLKNEDFSPSGNEIKVLCPKCNTEVQHTAEKDQTYSSQKCTTTLNASIKS